MTVLYHEGDSPASPELCYGVERELLSRALAEKFTPLAADEETQRFVSEMRERRHGRWAMLAHSALRHVLSDFDVNGLLDTYALFLLSRDQWRSLLGDLAGARLLDVGAGAGWVTDRLRGDADEVLTTETSSGMARRLRKRGYRCAAVDVSESGVVEPSYDLITCLNVLDRCDRPRTLLRRLREGLKPDGRLVIATPLPYRPFVYDGGSSHDPRERLDCAAHRFERAASMLWQQELVPLGLTLEHFTRAPYLSQGDRERPLYVLDDAIFVARVAPSESLLV